jgi:hypothetical protein
VALAPLSRSKISESVIDLKLGLHPVALVATVAGGESVSISSGLIEDSTGFSSELDQIKAKLPSSNKQLISVSGNADPAKKYSSLNKKDLPPAIASFEFNSANKTVELNKTVDFEYNESIQHVEV